MSGKFCGENKKRHTNSVTSKSRTIPKQPKLVFNASEEALKRSAAGTRRSMYDGYIDGFSGNRYFSGPMVMENGVFGTAGTIDIPANVAVNNEPGKSHVMEQDEESTQMGNTESIVLFNSNDKVELKATDMNQDLLDFVLNLCSAITSKHSNEGKLKCAQMIKKILTDSIGGLWFVVIGDDFSTSFYGTEFICGSFLMFYMMQTGFLLFRVKL